MSDERNRQLTRNAKTDPKAAEAAKRAEERTQAGDVKRLDVATRAKLIRQRLKKEHGWTSKHVSVRISRYSMGSSIRIRIKDWRVPLFLVQRVASGMQRVRYCEATGEILSGGNSFVFVDYEHGALDEFAAQFAGQVEPGFRFGPVEVLQGSDRYELAIMVHGQGDDFARMVRETIGIHDRIRSGAPEQGLAAFLCGTGLLSGHAEAA